MKSITTTLQNAIIAGRIATLFTITAKDGTVKRFTDHDVALAIQGTDEYTPSAGVTKFLMKMTANAEVSSQQVAATIVDMPDDEIVAGKWDGALLEVAVCSWETPSAGKLIVFAGSLGSILWTDEGFLADIQNNMRNLAQNLGSVVTGNCRLELYSSHQPGQIGACLANKAANTVSGTVSYVLTNKLKFKCNTTGKADGWGTAGFVTFTSGPMTGLTCMVKTHKVEASPLGESIELFVPSIATIAVGNTFTFSAGCDHTFDTCKSKFSNGVNFGGFPHIQPDVTMNITIG
jgi:uncharacterized phage protein (TIGR02218 family)